MVDRYEFPAFDELFILYNELDTLQKPRISPVASTLSLKIFENILYIVIKIGINIYFEDLQKARVF